MILHYISSIIGSDVDAASCDPKIQNISLIFRIFSAKILEIRQIQILYSDSVKLIKWPMQIFLSFGLHASQPEVAIGLSSGPTNLSHIKLKISTQAFPSLICNISNYLKKIRRRVGQNRAFWDSDMKLGKKTGLRDKKNCSI